MPNEFGFLEQITLVSVVRHGASFDKTCRRDQVESLRTGRAWSRGPKQKLHAPSGERSEPTTDHGQLTPCEIGTINAFKGIGGVLHINRVEQTKT